MSKILGRGITQRLSKVALVTGVVAILALASPVFAADPEPPDNLQIESVQVCRHLLEADDFLLAFHYNIHYDTGQPDDPANKVFTFRLLDSTEEQSLLGAAVPYAYHNAGYDMGCSSFYFPAATAPDWSGGYTVRISGNPEYWSTPPVANYTLVLSDYCQLETRQENQTVMGNYLISLAEKLENNWPADLVIQGDLGKVFNITGESYFMGSIPGLQYMCPQIFAVQVKVPEYVPTDWTEEQGLEYKSRFEGTWVGDALVGTGEALQIQWNVITGIGLIGLCIALSFVSYKYYATVKPAMLSSVLILIGGTMLGWMAHVFLGITSVIAALFTGYLWFFRHG